MKAYTHFLAGQPFDPRHPANIRRAPSTWRWPRFERHRRPGRFATLGRAAMALLLVALVPSPVLSVDLYRVPLGTYSSDYTEGSALSVAIAGNLAYVGSMSGSFGTLAVIDISNPANPDRLGGHATRGFALGVAVAGNLAYVAAGSGGLEIFDVSTPASPRRVGVVTGDFYSKDVAISGSHAYVAGSYGGLQVIDINDPANPKLVGSYDASRRDDGDDSADGVAVSGGYAFVAVGVAGLRAIDISDPAYPRPVGVCDTSGSAQDVVVSGNHAYVADYTAGLQVIDISDPIHPHRVGGLATGNYAYDVSVSGKFVVIGGAGLQVIDVSNPEHPVRVGRHNPAYPRGIAVSDNHAFVADNVAHLQIFDLSDAPTPRLVGRYQAVDPFRSVAAWGDYALVTETYAGLQVINIHHPTGPQQVGGYNTTGHAHEVVTAEDLAIVADGPAGLQVIDLRNPTELRRVGGCATIAPAEGVAVSDTHAFVVEGEAGLEVIDLHDPVKPRPVGSYNTEDHAYDAAVSGSHAFVADGRAGLLVLDIADPSHPRREGVYDAGAEARAVALSGGYAYLAAGTAGLQILDVQEPANPRLVGRYQIRGEARAVTVSGAFAFVAAVIINGLHEYVAGEGTGLLMIDIRDPANPTWAGSRELRTLSTAMAGNHLLMVDGWKLHVLETGLANPQRVGGYPRPGINGVAVSGGFAYVAQAEAGWLAIDVHDPQNPQSAGGVNDPASQVTSLEVAGDVAYLTVGAELRVIDVRDPAHPRHAGSGGIGGDFGNHVVAISGTHAYVAGRGEFFGGPIHVIDSTDPANPRRVSDYGTDWRLSQVHDLAVSDLHLVMLRSTWIPDAGSQTALELIDLSDPSDLRKVSGYDLGPGVRVFYAAAPQMAVSNGYAYVTLTRGSAEAFVSELVVLDLRNPTAPSRVVGLVLRAGGEQLAWVASPIRTGPGAYAYVADADGLLVFDISDPTQPRRVGRSTALNVADFAIVGNHLFVADAQRGLVVLDLFRPFQVEPLPKIEPGLFRLQVDGPRGTSAWVQRSGDLKQWEDWQPLTFGAAPIELSDPDVAAAAHRFYRAVTR